MPDKFDKHILLAAHEQPILDCLQAECDLSKQQLKRVMQNGAVWLETVRGIDRVRRAKKIVKAGETVHVYFDPKVQAEQPPAARLMADEGDYSIWFKPSGMYSQGSKWGDHCTLYRWAEHHLLPQRSAFIVHRLDRAAQGLMILAHKKTVAAQFARLFSAHEIYKRYQARVEGVMEGMELPLAITQPIDDKPAFSEIVAVRVDVEQDVSVVDIVIKTGRKHQIRKHLSGMGHPIVGDRWYGAQPTALDLQLCSAQLRFICPVSGEARHYALSADELRAGSG